MALDGEEKDVVWFDAPGITAYVRSNPSMNDFYLDDLTPTSGSRALLASRDGARKKKQDWEYIAFDEVMRATHYWEKWGKQAAHGLLQSFTTEQQNKELIYSGKCGHPPKYRRPSSTGSEATNLSLLSASDLDPHIDLPVKSIQKKKKKSKPEQKTDWEKFAKERHGALAQLLQADASRMDGYNMNENQTKQTDIMTREERRMLVRCGYTKSKAGRSRSQSTPQVFVTAHRPAPNASLSRRPPPHGGGLPQGGSAHPARQTHNTDSRAPVAAASVRPVSPAVVARRVRAHEEERPGSLPVRRSQPHREERLLASQSPPKHFLPSPFSRDMVPSRVSTSFTAPVSKKQEELREMLGGEGVFTQKARRKIQRTFRALDERTGYGDERDVIAPIAEEQGGYTAAEYARVHRYPQNIRIAPQLTKVIKEDITSRMGRPKRHEIKVNDMRRFNGDQPALGRRHRNLLVFNWLNALDEDDFDAKSEPDIYDIEGDDLGHTGQRLGTGGLMGRGSADSELVSEELSPRVSDEERWADEDSRDWGSDIIVIPPFDD